MPKKTLRQRATEINMQEKEWAIEKKIIEREQKLVKDKQSTLKKESFSTSKLLILFLFLNCTIIELFTGWVTIKSLMLASEQGINPDFSPLISLIGAVVGEVIGYSVYSLKSMRENTEGGIVYQSMINNNMKGE